MKTYFFSAILLLLPYSAPLFATPDAQVKSVLMPAWLERNNSLTPLSAGIVLNDNDKLITGKNARVLFQTADGSDVKLGENATLILSDLPQNRENMSIFTAILNVTKGAFRFTTSSIAKLRPREITIKVSRATIGIRGTDVWGKDGEDKGVVCLIEGKIAVSDENHTKFTMDHPLSFYEMPKLQAAKPVSPVDPEQLKKWALETEITQGNGATVAGGKWKVVLLSDNNQSAALKAYDLWSVAGYAVKLAPIDKGNNVYDYQLRIGQLPNQFEALSLAKLLKGKLGALDPVVIH